jgi:hypothetical protein
MVVAGGVVIWGIAPEGDRLTSRGAGRAAAAAHGATELADHCQPSRTVGGEAGRAARGALSVDRCAAVDDHGDENSRACFAASGTLRIKGLDSKICTRLSLLVDMHM